MPGFDGTGPRGRGPMTGGGRGFCVVKVAGRPGMPAAGSALRSVSAGDEVARLRAEAERVESMLSSLRRRIAELASADAGA